MLRKINAVVGLSIVILLLFHAIVGGYQLSGVLPGGNTLMVTLAWIMAALVGVHIVIGTILTIETLRVYKKNKNHYLKENIPFIAGRVSGFAIFVFLVWHIIIFYGDYTNGFRLKLFEGPQLILNICLIACVAVHLICNVRPMFISLGLNFKKRRRDVIIIIALIGVFCAAMFVLYYYRWNIGWKWNIHLGD